MDHCKLKALTDRLIINHLHPVSCSAYTNVPFSVMEFWYILINGFLSTIFEMDLVREVSTLIKTLDYLVIPLVQIVTSPAMRKYFEDLLT